MNRIATVLMASGALAAAGLSGACKPEASAGKSGGTPPPVPVTVGSAVKADAPIVLRTIGTAESRARVMLRPQVAGRIAELAVQEGTDVEAGQVLLRVDSRPFEAALRGAEANLARSKALASDAHRLLASTQGARASGAMSARESEEAQAKSDAADADVMANQSEVETARLNLAYCTVSAPFAGRLGQFLVKPGSIVKANEADLVELAQTDPIEVGFSVPEQSIPAVREGKAAGPMRIEALASGETSAAVGELTFVDNKVDTTTGTIRLKGTFPNAARRLWPGQFVNVSLTLGTEAGCVLVPESAVQPTQAGLAVFVVKPDKTVELRVVAVRRTAEGRSVIERGIEAGETVVTDGQLRLVPGSSVTIKGEPAAPAKG